MQTVGNVPDELVNATNRKALYDQDVAWGNSDPNLMPVKVGGGQSSYGLGYLKLRYTSEVSAGGTPGGSTYSPDVVPRVTGGFPDTFEECIGGWTDVMTYPPGGKFCDNCNSCAWDAWQKCSLNELGGRCVIPFDVPNGEAGRRRVEKLRDELRGLKVEGALRLRVRADLRARGSTRVTPRTLAKSTKNQRTVSITPPSCR